MPSESIYNLWTWLINSKGIFFQSNSLPLVTLESKRVAVTTPVAFKLLTLALPITVNNLGL
jgi:hypothetical protein